MLILNNAVSIPGSRLVRNGDFKSPIRVGEGDYFDISKGFARYRGTERWRLFSAPTGASYSVSPVWIADSSRGYAHIMIYYVFILI